MSVLTVTERGYGKRTPLDEYRLTGPRRQGHHRHQDGRAQRSGGRDAPGAAGRTTCCVVTSKGKMIRLHVDDVTSQGRNTMGVRIIDLDADDQVGSIARVEAEQAAQPESASP